MMNKPTITLQEALSRGQQALQAGNLQEAESYFRSILASHPRQTMAIVGLATVALLTGNAGPAEQIAQHGVGIDSAAPEAHRALGLAREALGKLDAAIESYREATRLRPGYAEAWVNLAGALRGARRDGEALQAARRSVELAPASPHALSNLGSMLMEAGQYAESIDVLSRAERAAPTWDLPPYNLGLAYAEIDDRVKCHEALARAESLTPASAILAGSERLRIRLDESIDPVALRLEHETWRARLSAAKTPRPPRSGDVASRPLRVGFVSGDLREHPVGYFFEPLVSRLKSLGVEPVCYATLPSVDDRAKRLRSHATLWRDVEAVPVDQLTQLVRSDKVDLLVDLAGHTGGNRLELFAQRPAPAIACWLGYPATTGIAEVDAYITDAHCDPPGMTESHFAERLVRLPQTFACASPLAGAPPVAPLPAERNNAITFGCLARRGKIGDETLHAWAAALIGVPRSTLLLVAKGYDRPEVREPFEARLARAGIDPARVAYRAHVPFGEYLKLYDEVDVVLDTFPFNGHTTTVQALWMGVPVLTIAGAEHRSRMGVSVLTNAGLSEWIAPSSDSFGAFASRHANDVERLSETRRSMRDRLTASPLMDADRFAADWVAAVRELAIAT